MFFINPFTCSPSKLKYTISKLKKQNLIPIIDYVNEYNYDIYKTKNIVLNNIKKYNNNYFAIKLSSINSNNIQQNLNILNSFCLYAKNTNSKILIDAEDYHIQPQINNISDELIKKYNKKNILVYKTYQMYRKDGLETFLNDMNKERNYSIGFKLVRGAYLHQDRKYNILCDSYDKTNKNYNEAIKYFCENNFNENDKLMCATHNKTSISNAIQLSKSLNIIHKIEFAQLMGMSDDLSIALVNNGFKTYKYLPYGNLNESLPYLLRRLYENYPMILHI